MVFTALLLGLNLVHFDGGTPEALAASMADSFRAPVVIESSRVHTLKPADYDSASIGVASKSLKSLGFSFEGGIDLVLSDETYPESAFPAFFSAPEPVPSCIQVAKTALDGGKFTFDTAKTPPATAASLADLPWSKPFKISPLLGSMALSISVSSLPESRFLDMVKKAVGGQWVDGDEGRQLVPDPSMIRIRLQNTLAKKSEDKLLEGRKTVCLAAIIALDDDALTKLFATAGGKVPVTIQPNSDLSQAIVSYIRLLADEEEKLPAELEHPMTNLMGIVDSRRAVTADFWADGNFQVRVPTYDPKTKVSGFTIVR